MMVKERETREEEQALLAQRKMMVVNLQEVAVMVEV